MEARVSIDPMQFKSDLFDLFHRQWLLLTAGDYASGEVNCMTVSWGFLGVIWNRPAALVVVRPQRHTLKFMEKFDSFTLAAFPESKRAALTLCGSKSGRDMNKIAAANLTPIPSEKVAAPGYAEAELIIECRKLYHGEFTPESFIDQTIPQEVYPTGDFHKLFAGGIEHIAGTSKYC